MRANRSRQLGRVLAIAVATIGLAFALGGYSVAAAELEPAVAVEPRTDLADGATVAVDGTGYSPNLQVNIAQCAQVAEHEITCNVPDSKVGTTDSAGSVSSPLVVRKVFDSPAGSLNCAEVAGGCFVAVFNDALTEAAGVPIAFL